MKKDEKKKEEKEENRGNQAFRLMMDQLLGKGIERAEGTNTIAQ